MPRKKPKQLDPIHGMDEKSRKVVFKITIKDYGHYKRYRMRATPKDQKRIDREFETEGECHQFFHQWQTDNDPNSSGWRQIMTLLTPTQLNDAQEAVGILPKGATLTEAARAMKAFGEIDEITVKEAYDLYLAEKTRTEDNPDGAWGSSKTKDEAVYILKPLIQETGHQYVKWVRPEILPQFWNSADDGQTRYNRFRVIRTFFNWCLEKKFHFENVMAGQVSPKVTKSERPKILSLKEAKSLLFAALEPRFQKLLPYVSIGMFTGMRMGEIHGGVMVHKPDARPLTWDDIELEPEVDRPYLTIPFTGRRSSGRNPELPANLVHLLKLAKAGGLDVFPAKNSSNLWPKLRKKAGFQGAWQENLLRHTAISYWYRSNPFEGGPTKETPLNHQFGNEEYVRERHYRNTAKMGVSDAVEFWQLGLEVNDLREATEA